MEDSAGPIPVAVGAGPAQVVGVGAAPLIVLVVFSATVVVLWPEAIKNQSKSLFMSFFFLAGDYAH